MSDTVTNNGRRRLSSILKKTDANNLNQCNSKCNGSESVERSQKRKSKRVSFGRQTIQEIDKVSEIHRNWADSVSSDEGMAGLSDICNLTSLKSKKSLENPQKYEFAEPPKSVTNILSSTQGFKFFDNTNLNIDDRDHDKENVEVTTEPGLFARDFLRSQNLIKSDQHTITYPDVNPPSYSEITKSSFPMQTKTASCSNLVTGQEKRDANGAELFSSKYFIQMALDRGTTNAMEQNVPINSQEDFCKRGNEMLNETDVDNVDMEMTGCVLSQHTPTNVVDISKAGSSKDSRLVVDEDVEMTPVEPTLTPLVQDKESQEQKSPAVDSGMDDMEITCAISQSNLHPEASRNMSNLDQSCSKNDLVQLSHVNPQLSVTPSKISDTKPVHDESEDMEFTCFVSLPVAATSSSRAISSADKTNTNRHDIDGATNDPHVTNVATPLSEAIMQNDNDDMEFTCTLSRKFSHKLSDATEQSVAISEGQVEKSDSTPSLTAVAPLESAHSFAHLEKSEGDEVSVSAFSVSTQSVKDSSPASDASGDNSVFRWSTSPITDGNSECISCDEMRQSENESASTAQKVCNVTKPGVSEASVYAELTCEDGANDEIPSSQTESTENDNENSMDMSCHFKTSAGSLSSVDLRNVQSIIPPKNSFSATCKSLNVEKLAKTIDEGRRENSTDTKVDYKMVSSSNSGIVDCVDMEEREGHHNVAKMPFTPATTEKVNLSQGDTIPMETFLENIGLRLPKTSWSRDSVTSIPPVELPDRTLASLFEKKFWTPSQNDIRESAISQIEEILAWFEGRVEQMKEDCCGLTSGLLKNKVAQQRLEPLREHCLVQGKVYWKQTKTKLYKGLTKALDEYISTHLEKVCSKFDDAEKLMNLASEESRKGENEQRPDAPTAAQEEDMNNLDLELSRLHSGSTCHTNFTSSNVMRMILCTEIETCTAKNKVAREYNDEMEKLEEDIMRLTEEWSDFSKKKHTRHQELVDFQRTTGREMSLETEKVLVIDFLNGTIQMRVEVIEGLSPWEWNNKISSYSFKIQKSSTPSPAEADLYCMIHNWWTTIFPTDTLIKSYPNLKSLKMLLRLLAGFEEEFRSFILTADWISSRLVCKYSTIPEERKFTVSFMPPRIGTDRFQVSFTFDQFREGNKPEDVLVVGANPTSYDYLPGPRLWMELQPEDARIIIDRVGRDKVSIRKAVEAVLNHVDYKCKMFNTA